MAMALVLAIVVGALWSSRDDGGSSSADVVLDEPGEFTEPTIAVNEPVEGDPVPRVDLGTLSGASLSTQELLGGPLVVNLWFADCPPCRRELPAFAAVHAEVGDRIRFVGVNTRDDAARTESFARDRGVFYENYLDSNGEFLAAVGITAMPTTLFVSPGGTILEQRSGELDEAALSALIEKWFG